MATVVGLLIMAALYFLPTIIASSREHNTGGVFIVNLILGWTLVGWAVALVMACGNQPKRPRTMLIEPVDTPRPPAHPEG